MLRFASVFPLLLVCCIQAAAADDADNWPQWRGPEGAGSVERGSYPAEWTADNVLWKSALPGKGCSTPIVWQNQIFVTAPIEGVDALIAFDLAGKELWQAKFDEESPGKHRNGSGANASPVTDGDTVFVYFKSGTLAAVGLDGNIRWQTNLIDRFGPDTLFWDHGTSPVLTEKYVVMTRLHNGESWIAAFDKVSGELKWK
ncbi:MAG: PQQ-binding-like beta-propeller repeat protein, partial [Pirellulales bacterium]